MSRILIVYYSRTGTTERIAGLLRAGLDCDMEEVVSRRIDAFRKTLIGRRDLSGDRPPTRSR